MTNASINLNTEREMSNDGYKPTAQLRYLKWSWSNSRGEEMQTKTLQQLWVSDYEGEEPQWREIPEEWAS